MPEQRKTHKVRIKVHEVPVSLYSGVCFEVPPSHIKGHEVTVKVDFTVSDDERHFHCHAWLEMEKGLLLCVTGFDVPLVEDHIKARAAIAHACLADPLFQTAMEALQHLKDEMAAGNLPTAKDIIMH